MKRSFTKYSGTGNDFILIDDRDERIPLQHRNLFHRLCHRHQGIGADGVILLQDSSVADYRMRVFNVDGSEAEMCGNGIRCLAHFIAQIPQNAPPSAPSYTIETAERLLQVRVKADAVSVSMGEVRDLRWNLPVPVNETTYTAHHLNTGVPHAVIFVEDLESLDLSSLGPAIRHHPLFQPQGANATFARIVNESEVQVRTFERGVEKETLACGTGATATAIAAAKTYALSPPLNIRTLGGEPLCIDFASEADHAKDVTLTGSARKIFTGTFNLNDFLTL